MSRPFRAMQRLYLRPLPLGERAAQRFNDDERVRGTPHPLAFVEVAEPPSPPRGEGTTTSTATRGQTWRP